MNQPVAPGLIPPRPGLEREEPEQAVERDIPAEDDKELPDEPQAESQERPLRQVERE